MLGAPLPRRVRRHPHDVDPTRADLHHEEHLQPAQQHGVQHGVHVQEVTRQQPTCLGGDRPGYHLNIVEFDSYESAMENSKRLYRGLHASLFNTPPRG